MKKEYLLTFSSYYKAKYAQEKLVGLGIKSTIKRAPSELVTSCGYALHLKTDNLSRALSVFDGEILDFKFIFLVDDSSGRTEYKKIRNSNLGK